MKNKENIIESIIFYKGEEILFSEICKLTGFSVEEIKDSVFKLTEKYRDGGINLVLTDSSVLMTTCDDASEIIEKIEQEEYEKELSKAALETLTIILYRGPIKRSMIDFIRGVNSQFTLRNLLIKGLIEKISDPKDERSYLYKPTTDLPRHMNLSETKDLQEFNEINTKIDSFVKSSKDSND